MDCPVCNHKNMPPFATSCPSCGADMVSFPILDGIEQTYVDTVKDKIALEGDLTEVIKLKKEEARTASRKRSNLVLLLLLLPLLFFLCGRRTPIQNVENSIAPAVRDSLELLVGEKQALENENGLLRKKLDQLQNEKTPHIIQEGDKLINLAEQYYDDGNLWKLILKDNPTITNPKKLEPGDTIYIRKL